MKAANNEGGTPVFNQQASLHDQKIIDDDNQQIDIQDHFEDVQMEHEMEEPQGHKVEVADVNQIMIHHRFVKEYKKMAYTTKNIKTLKRAYRDHMRKAMEIKAILKKAGSKVDLDSDSDESFEGPKQEQIHQEGQAERQIPKKNWGL